MKLAQDGQAALVLDRFDADTDKPIMTLRSLAALLQEDWTANDRSLFRPGFQAMAHYRFGVWREGIRLGLLRMPFSLLYRIGHVLIRNFQMIELHSSAVVGRRLRIAHQHGIVVHSMAVLGDECMIRQGVSIGISRVRRGGAGARRRSSATGLRSGPGRRSSGRCGSAAT